MSKTTDLGALFGVTFKRAVPITVPERQPDMVIPPVQDHEFTTDVAKLMFAWDTNALEHKNLMLVGPTGAGKSSLVEQYAARMNREVIRVGCHGRMEFSELVGAQKLTRDAQGGVVTSYQDGPLVTAMRRGSILLLDESNFLHPSVVGGLNGVLDGAPLLNPDTGEVIHPAPGFRIATTGNPESSDYRGTNRQNIALLDRYMVIEVDYLAPEIEAKVIHKAAGKLTGEVIDLMVRVAGEVRTAYKESTIGVTLSTRVLKTWGRMIEKFSGGSKGEELLAEIKKTLGYALLNRATADDRYAVEGIVTRLWAGTK